MSEPKIPFSSPYYPGILYYYSREVGVIVRLLCIFIPIVFSATEIFIPSFASSFSEHLSQKTITNLFNDPKLDAEASRQFQKTTIVVMRSLEKDVRAIEKKQFTDSLISDFLQSPFKSAIILSSAVVLLLFEINGHFGKRK